jgi:hypothetical protein
VLVTHFCYSGSHLYQRAPAAEAVGHCDWLSGGYASPIFAPLREHRATNTAAPWPPLTRTVLGCLLSRMASTSPSPEFPLKKESISFAPPPAELALPRLSQDIVTDDDLLPAREHPESSHRRGSSADSAAGMRKGRVMGSPPPPPAYTPRGTVPTEENRAKLAK